MDSIQPSRTEIYHFGTSPAIQDLARETGRPESEIASIYNQCQHDAENEIVKDPSKLTMDIYGNCHLGDQVWDMTRAKVLTPEEQESDEDQELVDTLDSMRDMFSPEDGDTGASADNFGAASEYPGIDNNSLGFSDEDMDLAASVADSAAADYEDNPGTDAMKYGSDTFSDVDQSATAGGVNSSPDTPSESDAEQTAEQTEEE